MNKTITTGDCQAKVDPPPLSGTWETEVSVIRYKCTCQNADDHGQAQEAAEPIHVLQLLLQITR
jgi:hypothetical protein